MPCRRCQGYLMALRDPDLCGLLEREGWQWVCLNCGDRTDWRIWVNRMDADVSLVQAAA